MVNCYKYTRFEQLLVSDINFTPVDHFKLKLQADVQTADTWFSEVKTYLLKQVPNGAI